MVSNVLGFWNLAELVSDTVLVVFSVLGSGDGGDGVKIWGEGRV